MKKSILIFWIIGTIIQNTFGQVKLPKGFKEVKQIEISSPKFNFHLERVGFNIVEGDIALFLPRALSSISHKFFVVGDVTTGIVWSRLKTEACSSPIFPEEFWAILEGQIYSDQSLLKMDGNPNIFIVRCNDNITRTIQVYWNNEMHRWDVRVYEVDSDGDLFWNTDVRFFLTQTLLE